MKTYVISNIDYWGSMPKIKIFYAGSNYEKAKAVFKKHFDDIAYYNGKFDTQFPLEDEFKDTSYDGVFNELLSRVKKGKKVEIDTEWVGDYDEPFCLTFEMFKENE